MTAAPDSSAPDATTDDLNERLATLHRRHGDTVSVDEIAEVVETIMATMKGDLSSHDLMVYSELRSLADFIDQVRSDVAALRPDEVKDEYIPSAADELDAIVDATAGATNTIMDSAEQIEALVDHFDAEDREKVMDATTQIFEACGFQDITGQRITKVVKALKGIEDRIDALVQAFGEEIERYKAERGAQNAEAAAADDAPLSDEDLLHGPQLKKNANTQAEIDALLADFD
jgi:chemotaxis protein CheZ